MTSTNLKIIACITMLIDHVGAVFFSKYVWLRIIGRIAFPIFAYLIVEGYFHTKNIKKYLTRLLLFGVVSEIPFNLAFYGELFYFPGLNIFFTLFLGLLVIYIYDNYKSYGGIALIIIGVIAEFIGTDYGMIGILVIFLFYIFKGNYIMQAISFIAITLIGVGTEYYMSGQLSIQIYSITSLFLLYIYNGKKGMNIKYLFYGFYPGHLLIIGLIRLFN
ncbi:MAG: conjugal transfer protein TraX [Vallitalea sp.]|jgi:hypothetical protein|nr:conjugal transfer protein TraX [Vallitalea sp.]